MAGKSAEIIHSLTLTSEDVEEQKVLNGYGVLFAMCVARESGKNPSEIINLLNKTKMEEQKEIKITPPEGYEIDTEKSTFDCIKFKRIDENEQIEKVTPWVCKDDATITGYYITYDSNISFVVKTLKSISNSNVFVTEKQARSALAMSKISQIIAHDRRFGGSITDAEWSNGSLRKYVIYRDGCTIDTSIIHTTYCFLAFHTKEQRDLFLKENEELVRDYLML